MARRAAEQMSVAGSMLEEIMDSGEGTMPLDGRVEILARLRESGMENPAAIDRVLLERVMRQHEALSNVQEEHSKLRGLLESLTEPPYFPAIFLATASTPEVQGALVQTDNERRVVQFGAGIDPQQLTPGSEVFLSHERNFLVAVSGCPGILTGDVAQFVRCLSDGRIVLKFQDQEVVVLAREALRNAALKAGDGVRFSRSVGLAFEKIDRAKGEQYFLEETPTDSFDDIGGLESQIEAIKQLLTLHKLQPAATLRYKLPKKESILLQGPPGNGKSKLARAICNWLASMSATGRARFINVKPSALSSMWYSASEKAYREVFRIAREAAAAEPDACVVIFFDEIDSIGSIRGESVHRIDDKILNTLFAELDGVERRGNIFVVGATNRMDTLDPALLRPGRMGDLVLHIPQPNRKAAHAILSCHLPADIPYAANGEGTAATREALLHLAVAQLFAENGETELANLTLRDGKRRLVRAADLVSGAQLESIAQTAIERACVREVRGGPSGVTAEDVSAAISGFFLAAPRALTPRNARNYIHDLPQDNDVVSVNLVERKVSRSHLYRVEAA